jgi:hypothetical protein
VTAIHKKAQRTVAVSHTHHAEQPWDLVAELEVLVGERATAVNAPDSRSVAALLSVLHFMRQAGMLTTISPPWIMNSGILGE